MQNMSGGKTALGLDSNIGAMLCYVANLVCYLGLIYSIIVLVTDKTNKLPRFHAMQSILLSVVGVLMVPVYFVMMGLMFSNTTIGSLLGGLLGLVVTVVGLALFVFLIISAVKAFNGEIYKIPLIGNFADQWSN